ncbi:aspartyl/asparaginyl beta-hydroxylase domain-containing protein [Nocardia sp. alder85J]|uniref:aspartyl/asparaginyl beta-hydroxylase domain-containing protein n=1 Tax=Nocardia sp. alder85J TaxID=2862949 RepID=UPI001CD53E84|nr:aspartyl/asparaginyl beta-hydroxylase domain-containing protein [Nocardia sp. alder85J]MCX4091616.1 aspartyl/asparaginyl beta-hydroxylase domain-containing protein [Nocardia sp. alder85J]
MRTQYVAAVDLDRDRLAEDLARAEEFHYSEAYSNYLIGGPWKSAMLWATGGDSGTGLLTTYAYDRAADFTEYGRRLPYLRELVTNTVDVSRLQFVRLAVFSDSVIVPHRDFLELTDLPEDARSAHRVHIPLITHEECFFSEDNTVYRMRAGEIWYFDAARIHAVASLVAAPRIHLIFDFTDRPGDRPLIVPDREPVGDRIPDRSAVRRPALPDSRRDELRRLADLLTMDTFREVFSIVIKTHFRWDGGEDFAWDTMFALARACPDQDVLPHTRELFQYYTLDRTGSKE